MQPTLFSSGAKFDYFIEAWKSKLPLREKQFNSVYPIVLKKLKNKCNEDRGFCDTFLDGTSWISSSSSVFLDHCHITEEGNTIIVEKLICNLYK